jgi:flagellar basal-body rod protein FlgC
VVFKAFNFDKVLRSKIEEELGYLPYEDPLDEGTAGETARPPLMGVVVDKVVRDDSEPRMKYDPTHPDANAEGYVAYPNINPVVEMADLIEATRAYQANVAAFQSVKAMATSAIDILRA